MDFVWNDSKRRRNLRKHGIDLADAWVIFSGPTKTILDNRHDYGETRFLTFGLLDQWVVAVTHLETSDTIRVISIRKATKREQIHYFEGLQD